MKTIVNAEMIVSMKTIVTAKMTVLMAMIVTMTMSTMRTEVTEPLYLRGPGMSCRGPGQAPLDRALGTPHSSGGQSGHGTTDDRHR